MAQKKKKEIKDTEGFIEIPFGAFDSETIGWTYTIPKGFTAKIEDGKIIVEKNEEKGSENEKIRKSIIHILQVGGYMPPEEKDKAIAYLEKQKSVQSDTEKQYVRTLESLISDFLHGKQEVDRDYYQQICDWLEERHIEEKPESCDCSRDEESYTNGIHHVLMNPEAYGLIKQKLAEWSEEDEEIIQDIIADIRAVEEELRCEDLINRCEQEIAWLKSLRPQPHWKPSEEQMKIFNEAIEHYSKHWDSEDIKILCSLYDDLQKLL